jgi:methyl-accepting chemotaxis protein
VKRLSLANQKLWQRVLSVSIRAKILGMVVGILLYWLVLVIARRFLVVHLAGPEAEARTFVDTLLLVSIFLFLPPSLLVAYLLTRAMTTPILELTRVAEAVRRGDLSQRARETYGDEIGQSVGDVQPHVGRVEPGDGGSPPTQRGANVSVSPTRQRAGGGTAAGGA